MEYLPESTLKIIRKLSRSYQHKFHHLDEDDIYTISVAYFDMKYESYDPTKSRLSTFTYTVVRNHLNNMLRKQYSQKRNVGNYITYEDVDHLVSYDDKELIYGMTYIEITALLKGNLPESEWTIVEDILSGMPVEDIMNKHSMTKDVYYYKKGLIMKKCRNIVSVVE